MDGDNPEGGSVDSSEEPDRDTTTTVTVVVPVYNEADYLGGAIPKLVDELAPVPAEVTILVVENGSIDDSAAIVRSMMTEYRQLNLIQLPEANYGAAIRAGFSEAETDWVVVFDIDYFSGSFLTAAMERRDEADLVIGSKRMPDSDDRRSFVRRSATWLLNTILRLTLGLQVSDTHGIKAIRRTVLDAVLPDVVSVDDLFDTEVVLRAERLGKRIVELPVVVEEQRESRSRIWNRVPRTLVGIIRIRRAL
ncbi:MAG: glycosyltransferase family 2 protein [Actinomycetota bacterium]